MGAIDKNAANNANNAWNTGVPSEAITNTKDGSTLEMPKTPSSNSTNSVSLPILNTPSKTAQTAQISATALHPEPKGIFGKLKMIFANLFGISKKTEIETNEQIFSKTTQKKEFSSLSTTQARAWYDQATQSNEKIDRISAKAFAKAALRLSKAKGENENYNAVEITVSKSIFSRSHKFTALLDEGNLSLSKTKLLGRGSFGEVFRTEFNKSPEALKLALDAQATKDVINEFKMLTWIHSKEVQVGIQTPPKTMINISSKSEEPKVGFLGALYHGTGEDLPRLEGQKALRAMRQVFTGLDFLKVNKIAHGDIKPANMLMKNNGETLHIADFGGASKVSIKMGSLVGTLPFQCSNDKTKLHEVKGNINLTKDDREKMMAEIYSSGDVYATCISFYEMILKGSPSMMFFDPSSPAGLKGLLEEQGIPEDLINLLERGLSQDYTQRPTPKEFRDEIRKHIREA